MTAIEFYDRTPIENAVSSLTTAPDKIIFIGDGKPMEKFQPSFERFLDTSTERPVVEFKKVNKNKINDIIDVLLEVVENEQDCIFDLTGGDDLVLVAMGIVFERCKEKGVNIQMQRFNIESGKVTDCDNDGKTVYEGYPILTVEGHIQLYGGVVKRNIVADTENDDWDFSDDFVSDIKKMWRACSENPKVWNVLINLINANHINNELAVSFDITNRPHDKVADRRLKGLLHKMDNEGLFIDFTESGNFYSFRCKNIQIKKCIEKAGSLLELRVLVAANSASDENGNPFYADTMQSVDIDWDGEVHSGAESENDTSNEIDVIAMRGLTPVFISCKNGGIEEEELYKLDTVTNRFGGIYAKKCLIATEITSNEQKKQRFLQRAKEMNIKVISDVDKLGNDEFDEKIKNLLNK